MPAEPLESKSNSEIDFSGLSSDSRKKLHRILYRQECRVWLLALGLSLWAILLLVPEPTYQKFREYSAVVTAILLAFWVGYPGQTVLGELRRKANPEEASTIERKFDSSWQSLWDFGPPIILPLLPFLGLLLYRLWSTI